MEINPEYSLEILMLKLKLQYFGHLMGRADSLVKTLMLGKDRRQEEKGLTEDGIVGWHHQLSGHESEQTSGDSKRQGSLACCIPWGHKKVKHYLETEQQQVLNIEIHPSASFQKFSTTSHIP